MPDGYRHKRLYGEYIVSICMVLNKDNIDKSMLTEYFRANQLFDWASNYLYREFPEVARWWPGAKKWTARQQRVQVGRIVSAHPEEGERYYLRVLLNHVRGATSFESLRTYDDNSIDECLTEASGFHMPPSLRRLFTMILDFCEPTDVVGLWDKHLEAMSDDFYRTHSNSHVVEQLVLMDIRDMLQTMGKDIRLFPLPAIKDEHDNMADVVREIFEKMSILEDLEAEFVVSSLNHEQRHAYDVILSSMENISGGVFFVDGLGGTGKTILYKALLATVRRSGKIAIATATSGVAASIMPGGRTAHSRFKIPLNIKEGDVRRFTKQSGTSKMLRRSSLILWDEATTTKRQAIEALDKRMRDIMDRPDLPFGGKTVVFGGDFRQVLSVVRKGTRAQIINSTLHRSSLWDSMQHLRLVRNMRAQSDQWFSNYLLRIGNGIEETCNDAN
ncbi:DNA helicase-like protein, partial [Zea mays]